MINSRPKPLAVYLFSNSQISVDNVVSNTSSGGVTINDLIHHNLLQECPFGGVGESGCGSYNGEHSFDTFSHKKTVLHKSMALPDPSVRFPPFTPFKKNIWKFFVKIESGEFKANFLFYMKALIVLIIASFVSLYFYKQQLK